MPVEVIPYTPEHADAVFALRVQTFTSAASIERDPDEVYIPDDRRLVAVADGTVVGHLGAWPFAQAFGGRAVRMGGVAAVIVAPRWRGRGIGRHLLDAGLRLLHDRGDVVSTLYPATVAPYRRAGWEVAGQRLWRRIATRELLSVARPEGRVELAAFADDDIDDTTALWRRLALSEAGGLGPSTGWVHRNLSPDPDEAEHVVLARRNGALTGVLQVVRSSSSDEHSSYDVAVPRLLAADADTARTLWREVGSHWSVGRITDIVVAPGEPLLLDLPEAEFLACRQQQEWMTRLVDLPGAIAARGFPAGLSTTVDLHVTDPQVHANAGAWRLEVNGGRASLQPGGAGDVRTHVRSLAPLYTGHVTATVLARTGYLVGPDEAIAALDAAFLGPAPFLRDYF